MQMVSSGDPSRVCQCNKGKCGPVRGASHLVEVIESYGEVWVSFINWLKTGLSRT